MCPIVVAAFLRSLPVEACQVLARGRVDAGRLCELRQKLLYVAPVSRRTMLRSAAFASIVGRINTNRLAFDQAPVREPLEDPGEQRFVRFQIDQAAGARNRRVVRRRTLQADPEEAAQRKRVGGAPRDATFRIDALEVAISSRRK